MVFNVFKVTPGKPMIYDLGSAKKFLEECKNPFNILVDRETKRYIELYKGAFRMYERSEVGLIGVDFELINENGENAVKLAYKYRKYINSRFNH